MSNLIRKISVGLNFPDGCLHYQVGKKIKILDEICEISSIIKEDKDLIYHIYLKGEDHTFLWKTIENLPVVREYFV